MTIVTSYPEPDLDGVSSMYAYSELLNKLGESVKYFMSGIPRTEVSIVAKMFGIKIEGLKELPDEDNRFILVDTNHLERAFDGLKPENIIEIIDHHGLSNYIPQYVNAARVQIDRVGATATIVAERFKLAGLIPSREAAILLYYGIISNSINLKATITSKRDIEITNWLKSICKDISEEKIKDIFMAKSVIKDENLITEMECDTPMVTHDKRVLVGQLEICDAERFIKEKEEKIIQILNDVKIEKNADFLFINVVDIWNGYSIIYCNLDNTKKMVEKIFDVTFEGNIGKFDHVIQRKEMTKTIRDYRGNLN